MAEGLKIVIGADIGSAIVGVSKLTDAMQGISNAAGDAAGALSKIPTALRPIDPAKMKSMQDAVQRLKQDILAFPKNPIPDPFKNIPKSANQAGQALTDVGRIAQDLPFGIIAIQNNLNPLVESFGRLRAATGSNKAAFAALGQSLLGPGGLGFALSAVTAAFVIYQNGIAGFNKKTKEAKDETQKLTELLKSVKSAADVSFEGEGGALAQIEQVRSFAVAVSDETKSQVERGRALEQLKGINKAYFGDLKLQEDSLRQLTPLVNEYSNAIIQQAIVSELSSEIGKIGAVYVKQKKAVAEARDALNNYKESLGIKEVTAAGKRTFVLDNNIDQLNATLLAAQKTLQPTAQKFNDLSQALRDATVEGLKFKTTKITKEGGDELTKQLSLLEKIRDAAKERQGQLFDLKEVDEATDKLAKLEQQIGDLKLQIAVRDAKKAGLPAAEIEKLKDAIKLDTQKRLNEAFEKEALLLEFNPKLKLSQIVKVEIPNNINFFTTNTGKSNFNINDAVSKATGLDKKIPVITLHEVRVKISGSKLTAQIEGKEKIIEDLNKQVQDIFEGGLTDAFSGIGEAFGEALASGDFGSGLKKAAENIMGVVGNVMQQLGRAVIDAAIKIKLLKEALEKWAVANPGLAILAGIGLVAAGAALKNIKFDGPKFADGGIVTGPIIGQVGEQHRPEVIMPLDRLPQLFKQFGGDFGGGMQLIPIINNEGLYLAMKRGERSAGRKF